MVIVAFLGSKSVLVDSTVSFLSSPHVHAAFHQIAMMTEGW